MNKNINIKLPVNIFKGNHGIYIAYNKKYDICGYGKTKNGAAKMFEFSVLNILEFTKSKGYYHRLDRKTGKLKISDK